MALRIIIVLMIFSLAWAIPGDAGRMAAILELGHGARALALGSAFVAHEPDASSLYWNPAALGFSIKRELATLHAGLQTDASYFYLGGIYPTEYARFGLDWVQLQMTGIPQTTTVNADNEVEVERYLSYTESSGVGGIGITLNSDLAVGVSLKTLHKEISDDYGQGHGTAQAIGLMYRSTPSLNFGLVVDELNSSITYDTGYVEHTPSIVRLGLAYKLTSQLLWVMDLDKRTEAKSFMRGHAGLEYSLTQAFYFALGYDVDRITAGAGFSWQGVYAQYAFISENRYCPGAEQFVTIGVRW